VLQSDRGDCRTTLRNTRRTQTEAPVCSATPPRASKSEIDELVAVALFENAWVLVTTHGERLAFGRVGHA
jgi:hypothetical protein